MKLSPRQVEVIRLMADGWKLRTALGCASLLGQKGEVKSVHYTTFWSLYDRGYTQRGEYHEPTTEWELTAQGRLAAHEIKVKESQL